MAKQKPLLAHSTARAAKTGTTGLTVIQLVQRALGLQGFLQTNQAERVMRDLASYLRQPAPDETLVEAAMWFTGRDLPDPERPA